MTRQVELPEEICHEVPMPLKADAYTTGSDVFIPNQEAKEKSVYYITFRRELWDINPNVFAKGDNRIILRGLSRLLRYCFLKETNPAELDETEEFLAYARISTKGLEAYPFPRAMWDKVVERYNGRPPIRIIALPEGSVCYPNEPIIEIENSNLLTEEELGELAAWFESTLLKVWAPSEFLTQLMHWKKYWLELIETVYGDTKTLEEKLFMAGNCLFNFGCRAGMTPQESEWLGEDFLLVFGGSDTFTGGYQAWKNSGKKKGVIVTVAALAHRNVQAGKTEGEVYQKMYDVAPDGSILSMVCDCYSSYDATEKYHLPLAKHAAETKNGKVIIDRFDSGNPNEQVLWMCKLAHKHGLSTVEKILNKEWRFGTTLKFFEGDGMTFEKMKEINAELMEFGFPPFAWGVPYGQGGGARNGLKRDNLSAKYAECAVGKDLRPVCKYSDTLGKTTLPGPFKLLRSPEALAAKKTIVFRHEPGEDARVAFFDGNDIWKPFKEGYTGDFNVIQARMHEQFASMPLTLTTKENHNYPCSDEIRKVRIDLLEQYAPKKLKQNY